jgi:Flp pilus assembly protein TadD
MEEAIQQLRRAVELDPQNANAQRNLTWALQNSGRK